MTLRNAASFVLAVCAGAGLYGVALPKLINTRADWAQGVVVVILSLSAIGALWAIPKLFKKIAAAIKGA